ncbi:hypothetical protein K431DRAFT_297311 [Polychaeton citri CBS 116435]|uniref:Uncharacterized protein n=1 Tax=Polychaeton citri CBS 116435 TaxID=1314669 RepID=A0A9P4UJJ1_9PEZI|nr:hypothetical protein K431DRAFT_297311 [Polychaeton citri CBS 116435]
MAPNRMTTWLSNRCSVVARLVYRALRSRPVISTLVAGLLILFVGAFPTKTQYEIPFGRPSEKTLHEILARDTWHRKPEPMPQALVFSSMPSVPKCPRLTTSWALPDSKEENEGKPSRSLEDDLMQNPDMKPSHKPDEQVAPTLFSGPNVGLASYSRRAVGPCESNIKVEKIPEDQRTGEAFFWKAISREKPKRPPGKDISLDLDSLGSPSH